VDETENRGVRANPKGKHQDGRDRKARRLPKLPDRKSEVVHHRASEMRQVAAADSNFSRPSESDPLLRSARFN
jgi:hypothetical protein